MAQTNTRTNKTAEKSATPRRPRLDAARRKKRDDKLEEALERTFPASDAPSQTQPSGGTTSTEPPPLGQKTGERRR